MIVADANMIVYVLVEGGHTSAARQVYERDPVWVAPPLWRSELLNVFASSVRAGRLTEPQAQATWDSALNLIGAAEREPDPMEVLHLAVQRRISAYDAQYVVLARMLKTLLVTADRRLVRLCPEHAVLMDQFLAGGAAKNG